jgi:hypothetical protein
MNVRIPALAGALLLATSAFALAADPMSSVTVNLSPQNNSGETATAVLTQTGDDVKVVVTTKGGPSDPQPIHIHQGTCAKLNPKPAYPLTTIQNGTSTTTLKDMKLSSLENGDYAINIHHSTTDVPTYYACGDIPTMKM